jgi:predicted nucleic acid-binding protein
MERRGCLSVQVLKEFFVTVTRKVPHPLDGRAAARIVESLAGWRVHAPGAQDVLAAIEIHLGARLSLWDAMVVHSAHQMRCRVLWSEDLSHGWAHQGVRVQNPFR